MYGGHGWPRRFSFETWDFVVDTLLLDFIHSKTNYKVSKKSKTKSETSRPLMGSICMDKKRFTKSFGFVVKKISKVRLPFKFLTSGFPSLSIMHQGGFRGRSQGALAPALQNVPPLWEPRGTRARRENPNFRVSAPPFTKNPGFATDAFVWWMNNLSYVLSIF